MRAASTPPSERVEAILAAARGGVSSKLAAADASEPAIAASPAPSSPAPKPETTAAPANHQVPAAPKAAYIAQPLSPELTAIRDRVLAEMAQEAKEKRQAAITRSWQRAHAVARGEREPDRPDTHGWRAIHEKLRAERAQSMKGIHA